MTAPQNNRSRPLDTLNSRWGDYRPAVFGVAYRLLGSVADAEDVVQDVWLKAASSDLDGIENMRAWLVTVAARRSYDILRSARVRHEEYVGPWLPEPLLTGPDVSEAVVVDDSVSTAMLIVMQELPPPERVSIVLHDVFEVDFPAIAELLEVSPANARQLASRARRRVARARENEPHSTHAERERVLRAFKSAYEQGDLAQLVKLLHPDVHYVTDGGGKVFAARRPMVGGQRVAAIMVRVGRLWKPDRIDLVEVNGEPALRLSRDGHVFSIDTIGLREGRIIAYRREMNPDKLTRVG